MWALIITSPLLLLSVVVISIHLWPPFSDSFTVENRTNQYIFFTPLGKFEGKGDYVVLVQYTNPITRPQIRQHELKPEQKKKIYHDFDYALSHIYIETKSGIKKQFTDVSRTNYISELEKLPAPEAAIINAVHKSNDRSSHSFFWFSFIFLWCWILIFILMVIMKRAVLRQLKRYQMEEQITE